MPLPQGHCGASCYIAARESPLFAQDAIRFCASSERQDRVSCRVLAGPAALLMRC